MIIPPRCFTCGNCIADKWIPFIEAINEDKNIDKDVYNQNDLDIKFIDPDQKKVEESIEGKILSEMGIHKYCCRIPFISNVHLISTI